MNEIYDIGGKSKYHIEIIVLISLIIKLNPIHSSQIKPYNPTKILKMHVHYLK